MDPYLERHWLDVHTAIVAAARNRLNTQLPDDLIARAEERIAIESDPRKISDRYSPDIRVLEFAEKMRPAIEPTGTAGGLALAPYRLSALVEPLTERFIEIRDATGERLITVIEFVSPTNKRGKGLREFRRKRERLVSGSVNFVEIDLVRTGNWRGLLRPEDPPPELCTAYRATIRAVSDPDAIYFQPISIRQPLPAVKIPLRAHDQPVELELQPLIEQAYVEGRYARTLDYTKPPEPPLEPEDAAWADELLRAAGKR